MATLHYIRLKIFPPFEKEKYDDVKKLIKQEKGDIENWSHWLKKSKEEYKTITPPSQKREKLKDISDFKNLISKARSRIKKYERDKVFWARKLRKVM